MTPRSSRRPSPYCEAHPNGTRLRCADCAEARAALRPVTAARRVRRDVPLPTVPELIAFESQWVDRTTRVVIDGRSCGRDEAVLALWDLRMGRYCQLLNAAVCAGPQAWTPALAQEGYRLQRIREERAQRYRRGLGRAA